MRKDSPFSQPLSRTAAGPASRTPDKWDNACRGPGHVPHCLTGDRPGPPWSAGLPIPLLQPAGTASQPKRRNSNLIELKETLQESLSVTSLPIDPWSDPGSIQGHIWATELLEARYIWVDNWSTQSPQWQLHLSLLFQPKCPELTCRGWLRVCWLFQHSSGKRG